MDPANPGAPESAEARRCGHCGAGLPAGARFCASCGGAVQASAPGPARERRGHDTTSLSERKQVTVMFADFSGFTALSERLDAEEVGELMNDLWRRLDPIITGHGGTINKHIGDAVMALFGARATRENEPRQAVKAALSMQAALAEYRAQGGGPPLEMRIGIHTGQVVLGLVGTTQEFTATGDTVNVASRLEQHAPLGGVLISHDTYRQVYGWFDVRSVPPLTLKGRAEPVQTYQVIRAKPRPLELQARGVEGMETPLIGREADLRHLQEVFQAVIGQRALRVTTIVGEAGIGKSRLVHEFQQWLELRPETVRWFNGRAAEETAGLPLSLVRDVLSARFGIQESDAPAVAKQKLEQGLVSFFAPAPNSPPGQRLVGAGGQPDAGSPIAEDPLLQAHFIGQLIGLDYSGSPYLQDVLPDAEQVRQRAFSYLGKFFAAAAAGLRLLDESAPCQAALLVLEDIHWADDGSLDLIQYLMEACGDAPLMVLCLARPILLERRPGWGGSPANHSRLVLEALGRPESLALVETILRKAPDLPQALRELVVGGAEGNPFFIEETIKMLIDEKVIVPGREQWRIEPARLAKASIPPTLTGVLQARLDGLPAAERTLLQRASVLGRNFWDTALQRLGAGTESSAATGPDGMEMTEPRIQQALAGLRRKELVFRRETSTFAGAIEYSFKHELMRKVAYEGILKKWRRVCHGQAADWLVAQGGERVREFAGLVAAHFEQAARVLEAAEWIGRAGQQARMGYAPASAIEFFQKALALLPSGQSASPGAKPIEWQGGLAEALAAQARYAEARAAYLAMRELAETAADPLAQARAWNGLAFLHERQGDNRASIESAEIAAILAQQAGDEPAARRERIRALHFRGWAFYRLGDAATVLALAAQTLELGTELGDRRGMATSFKLFGVGHLLLGHFREADHFFEKGLALCRELGDRRNAAAMLSNLGESARLRGDYHAAAELYGNALAFAREIGHRESETIYLTNLGSARVGLEQFSQAESDLKQVIKLTNTRNSCALSETFCSLAEALLGQGKAAEAAAAAEQALALAKATGSHLDLAGAWRVLGRAAAAPDGKSGARGLAPEACFEESLRVCRQIAAQGEEARTLQAWARYEMARGRTESGRKRWEEARRLFVQLGMTGELLRMDAQPSESSPVIPA